MILFNKFMKIFIVLLLFVGLGFSNQLTAEAAPVMWGKTELKLGQIGKVTILKETKLVKMENGTLKEVRKLTKGEEFRVYSYKSEHSGLYGVGGGSFIQKDTSKVKYETPSKSKLALLEQQTTSPSNATKVMWGKTELKKGQIGKVTILGDTRLVKLENGSLTTVRNLKKGEEFRVYTYKSEQGGLYGVGGGSYIQKSTKVKYETPSKSKLAQLEALSAKEMKVHFIDVGQGDSILIQSPNGKSMLIDGGGKSKDDPVLKFLKSQGISKLDYVVATHPDEDHIGGLISVLKSDIKIGTFLDSGKAHTSNTYKEMIQLITNDKSIIFKPATKGEVISFDGLIFNVLHANAKASDNNDASIVLKLIYNQVSFLLTGDADTGIESEMMSKYNVKSTILKAGHHGSDTSSSAAFINAVKPAVTILSYGESNSYGHPNKTIVNRLTSSGSKIYHTAISGTITVTTNGTTYSVGGKTYTATGTTTGSGTSTGSGTTTGTGAVKPTTPVSNGKVVIKSKNLQTEEVVLENTGTTTVNLKNWVIVSVEGNQRFTLQSYSLGAKKTVTLTSGSKAKTGTGYIKISGAQVWNNSGDPAQLLNPQGVKVSELK